MKMGLLKRTAERFTYPITYEEYLGLKNIENLNYLMREESEKSEQASAYLKIHDKFREIDGEVNIKYFLENLEDRYPKEVNVDNVSKTQFFTKEFRLGLYTSTTTYGVEGGKDSKYLREYVLNQSRLFSMYLSEYFNGETDFEEVKLSERFSILTISNELEYIGKEEKEESSYVKGNRYKVRELSNWFNDRYSLGYYITTEEYKGYDTDYCVFYPMESLLDNFKIIR